LHLTVCDVVLVPLPVAVSVTVKFPFDTKSCEAWTPPLSGVPSPKFHVYEVALLDVLASKVHLRLEQLLVNLATVGSGAVVPPELVKSSRFGDPLPPLFTTPVVALLASAAATVAGKAVGFPSRYSAAAPTTCGVAIDVPEMVFVAVALVYHDEVMPTPGPKMSTQVP
jgi:hypothetical protein